MPDPVIDALRLEADRRADGQHVPPVSAVHARLRRAAPQRARRRALPALAAAAAIAVALVAQQLPTGGDQEPVVIPPPPVLGAVAPPPLVATRLGAPGGHLNGPAVESSDVLAVSPEPLHGRTLRTVGVVRPRPEPDPQGRPLVDRCVYTYSEPSAGAPVGGCRYARPADAEPADEVTAELSGAPGRTFVTGTAPEDTAAVVLRTAGRDPLVVATADAGGPWAGSVYFTAWWPRSDSTVTALAEDRRELGTVALPSGIPRPPGEGDPELGTLVLGPQSQQQFQHGGAPGTVRARSEPPAEADVLARLALAPQVTRYVLGVLTDGLLCTSGWVTDHSGDPDPRHSYGGGGCRSQGVTTTATPIEVSRSFAAGENGRPDTHLIEGSAPAGTRSVVLTAPGVPEVQVPAYDSGARWNGRAYFLASWPSGAGTTLRALGADGQTLALQTDRGMKLDAFDTGYLAAYADCLEAAGVHVVRHPQSAGAGPAYEYRFDGRSPEQVEELERTCEKRADAAAR